MELKNSQNTEKALRAVYLLGYRHKKRRPWTSFFDHLVGLGELNPRPPSATVSQVHKLQPREVEMLWVTKYPTRNLGGVGHGQFYNRRKWGPLLIMS